MKGGAQLIVATHSPILLAYPDATIYLFDAEGIRQIAYEESEHFQITRDFLTSRELFLRHLLSPDPDPPETEEESPRTKLR